jgi:hypothetical protein
MKYYIITVVLREDIIMRGFIKWATNFKVSKLLMFHESLHGHL